MKKILVCFDGTWNKPRRREGATNVASLYRSVRGEDTTEIPDGSPPLPAKVPTVKWYDPRVGTEWGERIRGGVFGYGLSLNIRQGYKFLADKYKDGDEIYIFGFSRGAYTARSLAGFIGKIGLMRGEHARHVDPYDNPLIVEGYEIYREPDDDPNREVAKRFKAAHSWPNVKIKFLGVWDTIGALGLPFGILRRLNEHRYAFHDTKLSPIIENAYHAVAVDEHREDYDATLWDSPLRENQHMEQVWFLGAHADVGGGSKKLEYSDIALRWMQEKAQMNGQGLEIYASGIPDPGDIYLRIGISDSFKDFLAGAYALIRTLLGRGRYLRPIMQLGHGNESVHETVRQKIERDWKYSPKNPGL